MIRLSALLLLSALAYGAAPTRKAPRRIPTQRRIDLLLSTDEAKTARWGILARSLKTGRVAYQRNIEEHFTPASNTKLFSSALAMERLGPDYRMVTTMRSTKPIDAEGVLAGDLMLVGGGDPTLSARAYPYQKDAEPRDATESLAQLADQLLQRGLREVRGNIVGDDRRYVYQPYPEGWTVDDATWEYGAAVSALLFNDNAFTLRVIPTATGDLARITLNPPSLPMLIDNRVLTVGGDERGRLYVDRSSGSRQLRVWGTVSTKSEAGVRQLLAVDDPAFYAAHVLHDILTRRGVRIQGQPEALHRYSNDEPFDAGYGIELARRKSLPLTELARVVNKVSQNLHAEILLRETGRVRQNEATREAGLKELGLFLKEVGLDEKEYHFEDGSGLSRRTLVSPHAIVKLLTYMDARSYRDTWDSLLPYGAEDGSLRSRFEKNEAARVIHAKTGTLATTNALSGYITTKRGARLVFSILANNHTVPASDIRKTIDRIGLALVDWEGQ